MNILIAINRFDVGGAEKFAARLGYALYQNGHKIYYYEILENNNLSQLLKIWANDDHFSPNIIKHYKPNLIANFFLWKFNTIANLFGEKKLYINILNFINKSLLQKQISQLKINIINTHLFDTDLFFSKLNTKIPIVITMHGEYENMLFNDFSYSDEKKIDKQFLSIAEHIIFNAAFVTFSSKQNNQIFNYLSSDYKFKKIIYHGFSSHTQIRQAIPNENTFRFGMVARGLESKGWEILIKAFIQVENQNSSNKHIELILVYTNSYYMQELVLKYAHKTNIKFLCNPHDISYYYSLMDVFVLPTKWDSQPLVIIEALFSHIPIISTNIGEIPEMIKYNDTIAGSIINVPENGEFPNIKDIADTMKDYLHNESFYLLMKNNTHIVKQKFDMNICVKEYLSIFNNCIKK